MQNSSLAGKIIWITGASSGIGKAVLELFLMHKAIVIATSRHLELDLISADIVNLNSINECIEEIKKKYHHVDIAFLNAGNCYYLNAKNFDVNIIEKNFAVNFFGMANCIQGVLPLLRRSKCAQLVGMASSVAYVALPTAEGYGASKSAARYLLQALQSNLHDENITVSVISPGFVKTPLTDQNEFKMPFLMGVEDAAKHILDGIIRKKTEIAFPKKLIWIFKILNFLPDNLRISILARLVKNS
jgi:short-subunit dehydrogenase